MADHQPPTLPELVPPLVLVDGNNLMWRAEMGFPARITSTDRQRDVTGSFGFFALLRKGIREYVEPAPEIVVCFDGEYGVAKRVAVDPAYKANRDPDAAPTVMRHLPDIQRGLDVCGVPWVLIDDEEADDVIASYVELAGDREVYVFSRDRDFYQLVDDRVRVLDTGAAPDRKVVGVDLVAERFGVLPRQWCDRSALVGDPSDNLPGVRGIGPIRAARYLADGIHLDELPGSGRLVGKIGRAVMEAWENVLTWRSLVTMRRNLAVPHTLTNAATSEMPLAAHVLDDIALW